MGLIPENIIAQILDRADIVALISGYIPLKPAGRNFKAPCPFHHEKTPSFIVSPDKQIFHCFGCGAGGNTITFLMRQERIEFPEAVELLAQKFGIELPKLDKNQNQAAELRAQIFSVNKLAVDRFHDNLLKGKTAGALQAREYLKERGLTLELVKQFQIGFSLESWDDLLKWLNTKSFRLEFLEKSGLILAKSKADGYYDRFRQRIMFPIFDGRGQAVAFGARAMDPENSAKYVNSPETPIYTKGHFLYGLNWSRQAILQADRVIVVEGYMDFITPFTHGIENIVASLGTALTIDQIRLLRRYTANVIFLYDGDSAGQEAMLRSIDMLIAEGINLQIASLPQGEDPDSVIRKSGPLALQEALEKAVSAFDFKLKLLLRQRQGDGVETRAAIALSMLETISKFDNEILRTDYLHRLAKELNLDGQALGSQMKKIKSPDFVQTIARPRVEKVEIRPAERSLLKLMLESSEFIPRSRQDISLADFQNQQVRTIVARIFELFDEGHEPISASLMSSFNDQAVLDLISGIVAADDLCVGDKHKIYRDCSLRLKEESRKSQRQELLRQMEQARRMGDHKTVEDLSIAFNQLIKGI